MKKFTGIIGGPVNREITHHISFNWDKETAPTKSDMVALYEAGQVEILESVLDEASVSIYKKEYTKLGITGEVRTAEVDELAKTATPVVTNSTPVVTNESNGEQVFQ